MALGSCYNCIKYLMFIFNFIFWLVGCALLALGIWIKVDEESLANIIKVQSVVDSLSILGWVIIIVGAVVMVLGFLGCCGAIRESQCMLATFFVFLFIIFAALLAIAIFAIIVYDKDPDTLKKMYMDELEEDLDEYYTDSDAKKVLDRLHQRYKCCGVKSPTEFETKYTARNATTVCGIDYRQQPGCGEVSYNDTEDLLAKYMVVIIGVAFGIAVVMIIGMIFSMLLCCAIREMMD